MPIYKYLVTTNSEETCHTNEPNISPSQKQIQIRGCYKIKTMMKVLTSNESLKYKKYHAKYQIKSNKRNE